MPDYRSKTSTQGRNMAGARALWRATGMKDEDFKKPIIAIANSFTQFVPGHVHLKDLGQLVAREIERAGGVAKEFNTIAVDDGIAMGHGGMLYSLPSRDLIADSVEYMVNAHCADALVCISNCDKITPGMLMAAMRLNIPVIFVSGGPMEAGKTKLANPTTHTLEFKKLDLVDAMVIAADSNYTDEQVAQVERSACPTCGSCSGMFTANSMNCLTEALGLSQPGNGSMLATHADREQLFKLAGQRIVALANRYYQQDDESALPRNIAEQYPQVHSISQLNQVLRDEPKRGHVLALDTEFANRPDGLVGLTRTYDLQFTRRDIRQMDAGLVYTALRNGQVFSGLVYTTDGRLNAFDLTLLEDDLHYFPDYTAAPVVRQAVLDAHPQLATLLKPLAEQLDDATMRQLNAKVDVEHQSPTRVAAAYLRQHPPAEEQP